MQRRRFLSFLAAALPAARATADGAPAEDGRGFAGLAAGLEGASGADVWRRVRGEFLLRPGLVHLNTGTLGATPRRVLDAISAWLYEIEGDPASNVFGPVGHGMEGVRAKAAEFLGATSEEVALTENTTSGMNAVAAGFAHELRPGDEVLTTNHEHPGGAVCWEYLAKHQGVKIVQIPMPAPVRDAAQVLELVESHLTPRTKVVSVSHVETITGLVMPLAGIAAITRPRGILLVCDGAQAPGMLRIDVKALGVDTYASSSHKWVLASKGSGLLYIRKGAQERVRPQVLAGGYQAYTAASGTRNVAQILGHGMAIDFHNAIGRGRVEARCRALANAFRERLDAISGLRPLTPLQPELSCGIVSYGLSKGKNGDVYSRLLNEHDIAVKVVAKPEYNALRFSTHVYNNEDELDRAAAAIGAVLKG